VDGELRTHVESDEGGEWTSSSEPVEAKCTDGPFGGDIMRSSGMRPCFGMAELRFLLELNSAEWRGSAGAPLPAATGVRNVPAL
jgi:hypothetical protein